MRICYLRECLTLSNCLNFSLVAKQLNMTQPGLSRHISSLETELGVNLFVRNTHRVRLTEEGERFTTGIQKILEDYDFLCESLKKEGLGQLTVGVPYYGVNRYLSQVVDSFKASHGNVNIDYLPAYPDEIISGLASMTVDVAILPKVDFPKDRSLVIHDAFDEPVVLMMSKTHPLAAEKRISIDTLANQTAITLKGDFGRALFENLCSFLKMEGHPPPQEIQLTDSIESAALNMSTETGIMVLPGHLKNANISGKVAFVDVAEEKCCLRICLVHHSDNKKPVVEKFIDHYLSRIHPGGH